ncbi:MAG TPA: HEXXH motif-containing putative peptide modification protein [Pyrinomonadaceae bacterium]|nr:HEXXH motif-containing putative peptide modification protein [Pyrinomonadaceae bacterium]
MVGVVSADKFDRFLVPEGDPNTLRPLAWRRSAVRLNILLRSHRERTSTELSYLVDQLQATDPRARHRVLAAPETALYVDALLNNRSAGADIGVAVIARLAELSLTGRRQKFSWKGSLPLDYLPLGSRAVRMSGRNIHDPELSVDHQFISLSPRSGGPTIEVHLDRTEELSQGLSLRADRLEIIDGWMPFSDDFDDGNISVKLDSSARRSLETLLAEAVTIIALAFPRALDEMLETAQYLSPLRPKNTHTLKLPSFSSPALPGVIFVGIQQGDGTWIDALHLAESCVHEHLHNRLYLLDEAVPLTIRTAQPRSYFSPWKQTMRGVDGMLHAVYVFSHLAWFWQSVGNKVPQMQQYARSCVEEHLKDLETTAQILDMNELSEAGLRVLEASRRIVRTLTAAAA